MNTPMTELTESAALYDAQDDYGVADNVARAFWTRVDQSAGPAGCWPWTAAMLPNGYGSVWRDGRAQKAHRVAWILTFGSIPDGVLILHSCDNRPCCNPSHLWAGSHAENTQDMVRKGRHNRDGKRHVTREQVAIIRERYAAGGWTMAALGSLFGITDIAVHSIVHRRTWRNVA